MNTNPALRRGKAIQLSLMILALGGLIITSFIPPRTSGHGGFVETLIIVFFFTLGITGLAMLWTRWLPYKSPKTRRRAAIVSIILAIVGVIPMFIFDFSGPIIAPPPFFISVIAGGALLSLLTTPRVSSD